MRERIRASLGGRTADLVGLVLVLVCNPVLYYFNGGILHYGSPDGIAYVTLGRSLVTAAQLYVASWGHVDIGLILPPLYPLLIGVSGTVSDDLLRLAAWISGVSLILAGPVFFLLIRGSTGRLVAACTAMVIPLGVIFRYAFAPLTKAFFLLLMTLTLLCLRASLSRGRMVLALATGFLCALTFLTRPVGLFLLAFCCLWTAFAEPIGRGGRRATALRRGAAILAGFLLLVVPYAVALHAQTGQHPLQRTFRMGHYSIDSSDPLVLEEIRRIEAASKGDYQSLIRGRRMMRKLLPDGSEMYYALVKTGDGSVEGRSAVGAVLNKIVDRPAATLKRLAGNLNSLRQDSGPLFFALFLITSLTPVLVRPLRDPYPRRLMLCAWIWFYLIGISLITDLIPRYLHVVIPLLVLHVVIEIHALASMTALGAVWWRRAARRDPDRRRRDLSRAPLVNRSGRSLLRRSGTVRDAEGEDARGAGGDGAGAPGRLPARRRVSCPPQRHSRAGLSLCGTHGGSMARRRTSAA